GKKPPRQLRAHEKRDAKRDSGAKRERCGRSSPAQRDDEHRHSMCRQRDGSGVFPELEPVKEEWRGERGKQNGENGVSPTIQCDREPAAASQDPEKTHSRQQVGAAQPKPANERRADEWK